MSGQHVADERAVLVGQVEFLRQAGVNVLRHDAEIAARDFAAADEAVQDVARHVDGHGEADAVVAAAGADDGGVDADEPAFGIHQRAAGIAGVDGRVGLDEILDSALMPTVRCGRAR